MKCHFTRIASIAICILFSSNSFSQTDFKSWIKEVEIEGQKIEILRVPEDQIVMPRAKYDVVGAQKTLDRCYKEYQEGKQVYASTIEFNIQFLEVNASDWPVTYYKQELKAYLAYNKVQEVRDRELMIARANRRQDSIRLAKQVAGYSFINKPSVLIKQKPNTTSMTVATIYRGSYVQFIGAVEDNYIVIHAGENIGYTGYIKADDIVDSLHLLDVPEEEMARLKSYYYCKLTESAAYGALVKKTAEAEMATEMKQSKGTKSRRTYYTGPRGGCYYLTASGNKEYVDRSLCR